MTQQEILSELIEMRARFRRQAWKPVETFCELRRIGSDAAYEDAVAGISDLIEKIERDADPVNQLLSQTHNHMRDVDIEWLANHYFSGEDRARFIRLAKARRDDAPYIAQGAASNTGGDGGNQTD